MQHQLLIFYMIQKAFPIIKTHKNNIKPTKKNGLLSIFEQPVLDLILVRQHR